MCNMFCTCRLYYVLGLFDFAIKSKRGWSPHKWNATILNLPFSGVQNDSIPPSPLRLRLCTWYIWDNSRYLLFMTQFNLIIYVWVIIIIICCWICKLVKNKIIKYCITYNNKNVVFDCIILKYILLSLIATLSERAKHLLSSSKCETYSDHGHKEHDQT